MKKYFVILALALGFLGGAAAAQAASTLGHQGKLLWRERLGRVHRFQSRLLLCNEDASCKFNCDSTSACGDPAPGKVKICKIVYTCSSKPDRASKNPSRLQGPGRAEPPSNGAFRNQTPPRISLGRARSNWIVRP